ncbi:MAG TPA: metallophosphoesterase [Bacteroidales bacterium]|nr:metallophosphoesterase [Bacteroidales bacterium]HOX73599.1 metallophosphoesterase [Bacteroidales bacterium]HQM69946.1 metallophosphoesterase [Bacteroidales bacterium]
MKTSQYIIFFLVVFTVYFIGNLYIFLKGYNILPRGNRLLYSIIFAALASIFIIAKILESRHSTVFSDILNIAGGFWLAFLVYGFIFFLLSDVIIIVLRIAGQAGPENIPVYRKWAFIITVSLSALLITGGFINAVIPVVRKYDIRIDKQTDNAGSLRIAAVSDIHLGSIIRKRSIKKLSRMLEDMKPDAVFLLGDIIDGELGPVLRGDLLQYFTGPHTKDGLYAITGNHEFIGGAQRTIPYIESKGIRVLMDEIIVLPGGIQVIGRIDRDAFRYSGKPRKTIEELVRDIDHSRPLILLDHQPMELGESEKYGVDLQLSGHTHNGQLWPLNYIINKIFEVGYGYRKKGNTHIIVSSGYGLWGPRVRTRSRPEVLQIDIEFTGSK